MHSPAHHLYYVLAGLHKRIAAAFLAKGQTAWLLEYIAMLPAKLDEATYTSLVKTCGQHCNAAALERIVEVIILSIPGNTITACTHAVTIMHCWSGHARREEEDVTALRHRAGHSVIWGFTVQ